MILLQKNSIAPLKKIPLESMPLQMKERDSTATITPADMDGITINSWMLDDTEPGKGIVWRVKSIGEAYATRTPTVQLEHVINTLRDRIMFGEHKPKDITGNANATTCTAEETIRYILRNQGDWVLGRFDYSGVSNPYQFDGDTLFDAMETVTKSLKDAWWTYDTETYPFKLNIIRKSDTEYSELRPGRNLKTITKTIDKSGMYTRFYPIGKDDLHLSDYAVDKNTEYYGIVSKVETDASIDSEAELRRWASEQLELHAEPTVTIEAEGLDLADATGEELDRMWLGYCCRIPLAEFGTTISERIVGLTFPDKIKQPEVVKVTLSNTREDLTKILSESSKSNGKGKRTSTKQDKEDHAWFEDTNEHVAMCAIGIIGTDAQGNPNWTRLSELVVDGTGIHASVKSLQGEMVIAQTAIEMNEDAITLEAKKRTEGDAKLTGQLTVQADRITAEVTRASEAEGTLSGKISVEAGKITQIVTAVGKDGEVTAASICLAINNGGSTATINANKIYLLGQTIANNITADYISSKIASLNNVDMKGATVYGNLYIRNGSGNQQNVSGAIWDLWLSQSGNTYTLKRKRINETDWVNIGSFSRATTLTGAWSSGRLTVRASPQENSWYSDLKSIAAGDISWASGSSGKTGTVTIKAYNNGSESPVSTGKEMTIDATTIWEHGWDAYYYEWDYPTPGTSSGMTITWPGKIGGEDRVRTYTLSVDDDYAYLKYDGSTYARIANTPAEDAWTDGFNYSSSNTSSSYYKHGLFISEDGSTVDPISTTVTLNRGGSIDIYPIFRKDPHSSHQGSAWGDFVYGSKYTIKAKPGTGYGVVTTVWQDSNGKYHARWETTLGDSAHGWETGDTATLYYFS